MPSTSDQRALLFRLAEAGLLTPQQLAAASRQASLHPSADEWRQVLDRLLAFGGVLLLGAALIFFFAFNWDELHRYAKFGLAFAALAACAGAAIWVEAFGTAYRALLFGACVATGALLALIGQTYQTGADVWELFAAWAALMAPFALLSRSAASWALWLVVANAALMRALSQSVWWGFVDTLFHARSLLLVAALNLAVLLVFEAFERRLLLRPARRIQRLAALGVLAPLCVGAVLGWWEAAFRPALLAFVCVAAVGAIVYLQLRRDLAIVGLVVYGAIAVFAAGLAKLLPGESFLTVNLVGLVIIGASAWAGVWLLSLHRQDAAVGGAHE
ncbi:MAG TPA: DUF2157 domain-containing protein [Thauera sp.]|nr:DUF2157 domain-containing protein [Thauera sp.]